MKISAPGLTVALCLPLMLVGCASVGPPLPPSLELPTPPRDLRATRKGNKVTLSWSVPLQTTDRQTVRWVGPTRICRSGGALAECGVPVGELPAELRRAVDGPTRKQTAMYSDPLPRTSGDDPLETVTYAVEVLNSDSRGAGLSNSVVVPVAKTLEAPTLTARAVKDGVLVGWVLASRGDDRLRIAYRLRLFRKLIGENKSTVVAEVPIQVGEASGEFADQRIEWEKTYRYRAAAVTVISAAGKPDTEIEGEDSEEAEVFAHDVFAPSTPVSMQAVFSTGTQGGFIDLIWTAVSDADVAGYNVYRREAGAAAALLNDKPLNTPAYRDGSVVSGRDYFYSVSAVDVRGNESGKSAEATEHVP